MSRKLARTVEDRVNQLHDEVGSDLRTSIEKAALIGKLLTEQKGHLEHGQWGTWMKENLKFSASSAQAYMKVHEHIQDLKNTGAAFLTDGLRYLSDAQKTTGDSKNAEIASETSKTVATTSINQESEKHTKTDTPKADKKPAAPPALKDEEGIVIPEKLHKFYTESRAILQQYQTELIAMEHRLTQQQIDDSAMFRFMTTQINIDFNNLKRLFRYAMPHAVCPYCSGVLNDNCESCKRTGFLTKPRYDIVKKELKSKKAE